MLRHVRDTSERRRIAYVSADSCVQHRSSASRNSHASVAPGCGTLGVVYLDHAAWSAGRPEQRAVRSSRRTRRLRTRQSTVVVVCMCRMVADDTSRSAEERRRSGHARRRVDTVLTAATRFETWRRPGCVTDAE